MIISNDTFAVHFVEAEVRGDGEDSEEAQHEAHGGGGQQGGGGRGRGRGDGAAHRSWTFLNVHCQLLLFLGSSRPGSLLLSCVACHIQCKSLKVTRAAVLHLTVETAGWRPSPRLGRTWRSQLCYEPPARRCRHCPGPGCLHTPTYSPRHPQPIYLLGMQTNHRQRFHNHGEGLY